MHWWDDTFSFEKLDSDCALQVTVDCRDAAIEPWSSISMQIIVSWNSRIWILAFNLLPITHSLSPQKNGAISRLKAPFLIQDDWKLRSGMFNRLS